MRIIGWNWLKLLNYVNVKYMGIERYPYFFKSEIEMTDYHKMMSDLKKLSNNICQCLLSFEDIDLHEHISLMPYDAKKFVLSYVAEDDSKILFIPNKVVYDCLDNRNIEEFLLWYTQTINQNKIKRECSQATNAIDVLMNTFTKEEIIKALDLPKHKREKYFISLMTER